MATSSDGATAARPVRALVIPGGSRTRRLPVTPEEIPAWRAQVIATVRALTGTSADDEDPADAVAVSGTVANGLATEEYLLGRPWGQLRAVLVRPAEPAEGPWPAVLVCPGRNAVVEQVTGTEPPDYPDRDVAARFASAGLAALTLDYGFDGSVDPRWRYGRDEAAVLAQLYAAAGRCLLAELAADAAAAFGWLSRQPWVRPGAAGLFGHSLGAAVALHAALTLDQPPPLCTASHLGSYQVLGHGHPALLLPGIARDADLPDLYAALVPVPLHVQYGRSDPQLDPADAEAAGQRISAVYRLAGAEPNVQVRAEPMGHGTATGPAIEFFRQALAAPRPKEQPRLIPPVRVTFDATMRAVVTAAMTRAFDSGILTLGPAVADFERAAEPWAGGQVVAVDSGSSALEIVLRYLEVAGRVVLVPVNTFFATAAAAVRAGADVDFVDLEPAGLGLSPEALAGRLDQHGDRVAAVIAMHTGGFVAPALDQVIALCHDRGVPVLEDAAHAFGSSLHGRPAGSIADAGAFSFYPTKVLTTGEGGAVTAHQDSWLSAFRQLRDHGRSAPGATTHDRPGSNWRMSEFHAAVGLAQLGGFAERTERRAQIAARYDEALADLAAARIQPVPPGSTTSWYKYIVELPAEADRAALKARLRTRYGIALAGEVYDLLLTEQPFFSASQRGGPRGAGDYPNAERFSRRHICLPIYAGLTTAEQDRVIEALRKELALCLPRHCRCCAQAAGTPRSTSRRPPDRRCRRSRWLRRSCSAGTRGGCGQLNWRPLPNPPPGPRSLPGRWRCSPRARSTAVASVRKARPASGPRCGDRPACRWPWSTGGARCSPIS
jgi:perosamine synthetase